MKEKEILKMLDYLSKDNSYDKKFFQREKDNFYIEFDIFKCEDKEIKKRDHASTRINFNDKTIVVYACDENYHNGSDYNNIDIKLSWDNIDSIYDLLASRTKAALLKEEYEKIKQAQEKKEAAAAEKRLEEFLK